MKKETQGTYALIRNEGGNYCLEFIRDVVHQRERGASYFSLSKRYGIPVKTISGWMAKHGSEQWHKQKRQRFTWLQKRSIVMALEQGKLTPKQAMSQYSIRSASTLKTWSRAILGEKSDLRDQNQRFLADQTQLTPPPSPNDSAEIAALKKALEEAQLKVHALETLVDVAEDMFKIDIRKKLGAKRSPK